MAKSYLEIINSIEKKSFSPVYLLDGEEPYYIDRVIEAMEAIIPEEEKDFNLTTFYGKETNWQDVISAARQFPMFGERILIILREAAQMKNLNELAGYISNPQPSTILLIEHRFKKVDGRSKLPKLAAKFGTYYTSNKLKEYEIPQWIINFCTQNNSQISLNDAQLVAGNLGDDLQKIANELGKIWINKDQGRDITTEKIEKYIGINREYNLYELPEVLFDNNQVRLANMLNYLTANSQNSPMLLVIGGFYNFLRGVYLSQQVSKDFVKDRQMGIYSSHRKFTNRYSPFQIHQAIMVLERISAKAVGIHSANKDDLLKEMIGRMQVVLKG